MWDFLRNFGAGIAHSEIGLGLLALGIVVAVWGAMYFKKASAADSSNSSGSSKGWLFIVFAAALIVAGAIVTARVGANYVPQAGQQVQ